MFDIDAGELYSERLWHFVKPISVYESRALYRATFCLPAGKLSRRYSGSCAYQPSSTWRVETRFDERWEPRVSRLPVATAEFFSGERTINSRSSGRSAWSLSLRVKWTCFGHHRR